MSGRQGTLDEQLARVSSHRKRELLRLSLYLVGMLVSAGVVATMLERAYSNEGLFYEARWLVTDVLQLDLIVLPALFAGTLFGLIGLVIIDWYKRIQGILLFAGVVFAALGLVIFGGGSFVVTLPWLSGVGIGMLLLGVLIGAVLGGAIGGFGDGRPWQFPRALSVIGVLIFLFVLVGLVDAHLLYQPPIDPTQEGSNAIFQSFAYQGLTGGNVLVLDLVGSVMLLYLFAGFAGYDASKTVVVLGPAASGKTWLLTGLNYVKTTQAATDADVVSTAPEGPLIEATTAFSNREYDAPILQGTLGADHLWFRYPHGDFFRTEVAIESLDYPGESLEHVEVPASTEEIETAGLQDALIQASDEADTPEEIGEYLSEAVYYADAVVTLIPLDDYGDQIENPPYGMDDISPSRDRMAPRDYIGKYARLASNYPEKDFIPVIAKADYAKEDFVQNTRHHSALGQPQAFSEYISEEVLQHSLKPYTQEISDNRPYPVYFAVDETEPTTESGNINPDLDKPGGQPILRGSDALLSRIGE